MNRKNEYYVLNQPSVEDAVYDKHLKELRELETQYNFIFPNSPTQKAGYTASNKFRPVVRQNPMLSLDSVDNYEDLLNLVYQDHQLVQISTRGNGIIGEDITFNKKLIKNIPFNLKKIANCEVRGEVYMKKEEFVRLNEELKRSGNKLLANPRNAASGSLRTLIPLQNRSLHFFAYQLFNDDLPTQLSCLQELEKLGFSVSPDYRLFKNIEKVEKFIQKQAKKREKLDFESDGVVVKVNNYSQYEKLGQTSRFPRWAIAYKFPASVASSLVKNIYVEVSRSGRITYVAEIEPVILQGSKISKVTLHNYAFIANLKLNVGDEIVIKKAGDVCKNDNCPQKIVNYLTHFASKNGLDIKGISEKIIKKLYENNLLNQPTDFYQLYQKEKELLKLEGFKRKSVTNILTSIEESKKSPFANLLTALGIPLLSSVKAKKLTIFYPNLTSFLIAAKNEEWEKFQEILGEETQKEIKKYWQKLENQKIVQELKEIFNLDKATSLEELARRECLRSRNSRLSLKLSIMARSKKLPPIHPGEMLREEFLVPLKMKPEELAEEINVPVKVIKDICQEKKDLTPEIICRLAIYFKMSYEFWLGMQQDYERECLEDILENQEQQIKKEINPLLQPKTNGRLRKHA
ncbi:27238_t:CDS:2 [Gigaspora margarita]|uniref:DNA ligase (NAD(+)) n=1 Tax=Gigaspora margarita TaxID=4874 RepID=A0ABM8VVG3_GIGMA|nr:27238_t:CDS:2 [Gigaspora margarita]